ncbi:MAG TPA: DNA-binding protein [Actinobacteria bacterium]|nr:DNA-binding protein [Actinomycetota bacterium]
MQEDIPAFVAGDKAEALRCVVPLHLAGRHRKPLISRPPGTRSRGALDGESYPRDRGLPGRRVSPRLGRMSSRPRSLADDLRRRDDAALVELLRLRPDLVEPVPADLGALATRATGAPSMMRALDHLDAFALSVARTAAAHSDPLDIPAVIDEVHTHASLALPSSDTGLLRDRAQDTVDLLQALGMIWGPSDHLTMVRGCRELLLQSAPGTDGDTDASAHSWPSPHAPSAGSLVDRGQRHVIASAAQAAMDAVRLVDELCRWWAEAPVSVVRTDGIGQRDLTRTAEELGVDEHIAAALIEIAHSAGLLASDGAVYTATTNFADWSSRDIAEQWSALAVAWLHSDRLAGLVGSRDVKDTKVAALSTAVERGSASTIRLDVLTELATLDPHHAIDADDVITRLRWRRPRRTDSLLEQIIEWTLTEASFLGITGLGALTPQGRALLDGSSAAEALHAGLPAQVDHIVLQPDLTAIAPGPLQPTLAAQLATMADVESTGGATVYRFSEKSLRRALDLGQGADEVLAFIASVSRTAIPQPLEYLVADLAKRHSALRLGTAMSYLRCDDTALLDTLCAAVELQPMRPRRIADTVVITAAAPALLLERLHAMGLTPTAEGPEGAVTITRSTGRRPTARRPVIGPRMAAPDDRLISAAVRALRSGEQSTSSSTAREDAPAAPAAPPPKCSPTQAVALLKGAVEHGRGVRIGYAGSAGDTEEHHIDPVRVGAGRVTAYDHRTGSVRSFTISRITGVEAL